MAYSPENIYLGELNHTPLGNLRLAASDLGLLAVEWADNQPRLEAYLRRFRCTPSQNKNKLKPFTKELTEYFKGRRREFSFPIDWASLRPFQQRVLKIVFEIPYGEIRTYADVAIQADCPHAFRAVGRANATNPMPLVIPCHRVIGRDGKLHGYGGGDGLPTKEWLLKFEGAVIA